MRDLFSRILAFFNLQPLLKKKRVLERLAIILAIFALLFEIINLFLDLSLKIFNSFGVDIRAEAYIYLSMVREYIPFLLPIVGFGLRWAPIVLLAALVVILLWLAKMRSRMDGLIARLRLTTNELDRHTDYRARYAKCEGAFHSLSSQNASCDRDLFNILFADLPRVRETLLEKMARAQAVKAASSVVNSGLIDLLDTAKSLFDAMMTDDECGACLQLLERAPGQRIDEADVVITLRDTKTGAKRGTESESHKVGSATLSERIFIHNEPVVYETGLSEKIKAGVIRSPSKRVGMNYDAVCIFAAPNLKRQGVTVAALCLDNMRGIPKDKEDVCFHFGKELAWRIAIMQYRLSILANEYGQLMETLEPEENDDDNQADDDQKRYKRR